LHHNEISVPLRLPEYICPCHGAKFAGDGKVLGGPASASLKTYTAKIDGDQVLVKVG
jgi:cytochrome b6-f complex iron-sulfur subunit